MASLNGKINLDADFGKDTTQAGGKTSKGKMACQKVFGSLQVLPAAKGFDIVA